MTWIRYHHKENPWLSRQKVFCWGEIPDDLEDGLIVETAPDDHYFAVRDIIAEFFTVSDGRLASIRAGDEDNSVHFLLALAAYRAGLSDCDCRDD